MSINSFTDTICAITTPLATGGVGVVRLSGDKTYEVISKVFSTSLKEQKLPEFEANRIYYGWIVEDNNPVDEVIILAFKNPKSFTGEDVVEIQCHGGINVVKNILNLTLKNGARLAQKGEFTKRAFLNGKVDLSKAEAILDLIHSKTDKFSKITAHNLAGKLKQEIEALRKEILDTLSIMTAAIDFPEEVEEPGFEILEEKTKNYIEKITSILGSANSSNVMRQGIKLAIAGRPNVGKSSLFNALLSFDRAIVTQIAGTTRDVLAETIDIGGVPVTLIDTAGLREIEEQHSSDYIEKIGIDVSKKHIDEADIVLFVYDLVAGLEKEDEQIFEEIKYKPYIKIASKADIADKQPENAILVSSKTGFGIDKLKKEIEDKILSCDSQDTEFSTNLRQQECLNQAKEALMHAKNALNSQEIQDLISIDIKTALLALGEITGEVVTEEILDNIFENFCIGK